MTNPKIIILPGNGDSHIESDHWYGWLRDQLTQEGFEIIAHDMPDPIIAHESVWMKHILESMMPDNNTIIVGHSTGAVCSLRLLEKHKLLGAILLGCNHTDLGYPEEKEAGYYDRPWNWSSIKSNAQWIVQFASQDDPFIPIKEPRLIHEQINSEYHEFTNRGHFMSPDVPEILEVIRRKISHD